MMEFFPEIKQLKMQTRLTATNNSNSSTSIGPSNSKLQGHTNGNSQQCVQQQSSQQQYNYSHHLQQTGK